MLAAVLALCSSLVWGVADFVGGVLVRRHPVATISALSHATGLAGLGVVAGIMGLDRTAFLLGLAAGGFGAASLCCSRLLRLESRFSGDAARARRARRESAASAHR